MWCPNATNAGWSNCGFYELEKEVNQFLSRSWVLCDSLLLLPNFLPPWKEIIFYQWIFGILRQELSLIFVFIKHCLDCEWVVSDSDFHHSTVHLVCHQHDRSSTWFVNDHYKEGLWALDDLEQQLSTLNAYWNQLEILSMWHSPGPSLTNQTRKKTGKGRTILVCQMFSMCSLAWKPLA